MQANKRGVYTRAGSGSVRTNSRRAASASRGHAQSRTKAGPGHIHIRVVAKFHEMLLTRYEPRGARRGTLRLVGSVARSSV